jgi:hypothetical protein
MQVRSFIPALLVVAAIGTGAQASRGKDSRAAEYARLLAGKTAERPVDCIDTRFTRPSLTAYGDKLVYKVSNKLVYVSDTAGGCQAVARGDTLVTNQFQQRLCRGDLARTVDLRTGINTGSCAIGAFTPYRAR